jgi:hypothetical protein
VRVVEAVSARVHTPDRDRETHETGDVRAGLAGGERAGEDNGGACAHKTRPEVGGRERAGRDAGDRVASARNIA